MSSINSQDNRGWEEKFYSVKDDLLEDAPDYSRYESGFYWYDKKHSGLLFVSPKMIDKYQLKVVDEDKIQLWIDDHCLDESDKLLCLKKYTHIVYLHHAEAFSIMRDGLNFSDSNYTKTPHGECYSRQFVAWFNDFSVDMLGEADDQIKVVQWCHG